MENHTEATSGLKADIEAAEEHTLGKDQHAQLEAKETVFHQYIPVPVELGLLGVVLLGVVYFVWSKYHKSK